MILTITEQKGMEWVLGESELAPVSPSEKREGQPNRPTLLTKPESP